MYLIFTRLCVYNFDLKMITEKAVRKIHKSRMSITKNRGFTHTLMKKKTGYHCELFCDPKMLTSSCFLPWKFIKEKHNPICYRF